MNVLEDFWYGNLDPAEYDANPSKEYKELVRLISRNEEKLLATMTEEQNGQLQNLFAINVNLRKPGAGTERTSARGFVCCAPGMWTPKRLFPANRFPPATW